MAVQRKIMTTAAANITMTLSDNNGNSGSSNAICFSLSPQVLGVCAWALLSEICASALYMSATHMTAIYHNAVAISICCGSTEAGNIQFSEQRDKV